MATSQGSGPGRHDMDSCWNGMVIGCGWAYLCLADSGKSRASGNVARASPTGCQALWGWHHGFRALPGAVGHYGKKLILPNPVINKQPCNVDLVLCYMPWQLSHWQFGGHRENVPSAKLPQMRMISRGNVPSFSLTPIWPGYPQLELELELELIYFT